ncbi:MAG TPA: hypothetical protein VLV83_06380 [Acidobacteriota bacterium]|nr:hypothetical protein [Acidobacteriota bacterium]
MSFLDKLGFGKKADDPSVKRCQECGSKLPDHTDWCPTQSEDPEPRTVESPVPDDLDQPRASV